MVVELTSRQDEGRRLIVATRWFQVSVIAALLVSLVGAVEGASVPGLMDADGEFPGWIGWVKAPRRAVTAFCAIAALIGIIIIARSVAPRRFGFWGIVFVIDALIMVVYGIADLAETIVGALSGAPAWSTEWLSFADGWGWLVWGMAVPIAGAVCVLHLNRRWDGALCSPIRVWLLAFSAILFAAGLEFSRYILDVREPGSPPSPVGMALMAATLLLIMAWQFWLLVELQRAAWRLGRLAQAG